MTVQRPAAGLRVSRRSRRTGCVVSIYDGKAAEMDTAAGRWQTVCEDHGSATGHETYRLALHWLPAGDEWCEDCRPWGAPTDRCLSSAN